MDVVACLVGGIVEVMVLPVVLGGRVEVAGMVEVAVCAATLIAGRSGSWLGGCLLVCPMASMALSMMALSLLCWSAANMAKCSLASAGTMVQLVGTDLGVMVLLSSPAFASGLAGLENTVRFDMAGCCWGWLCWHNL
eukprot:s1226_g6.t1